MKKKYWLRFNILSIILTCYLLLNFTSILTAQLSHDNFKNLKKLSRDFYIGPEIIFYNANVITLDENQPFVQAVAIDSNRISAIGSDAEILGLQAEHTQLYDLQGKTVFPGFTEGHSHILRRAFVDDGIEGIKHAAMVMAADGYTTVHELNTNKPNFVLAAAQLAEQNELAVRVNFYMTHNSAAGPEIPGNWNILPYTTKKDTMVRIVGVKMFADGGIVNYPCLSTVYQDGGAAGTNGDCYFTQTECDSAVQMILDGGYPIAVHAIGDSGSALMLHAFENAFNGQGNSLRCRIEHLGFFRDDQITQMADLGVIASIQYTWAMANLATSPMVYYEPEVYNYRYPWRKMINNGITILGGNDAPYAARWTQVMHTVSAVVTRQTFPNDTLAWWLEGNQLSVDEAIRGMTLNSAWTCFEEDVKGSISAGKLADLTVLSDDPYNMDPFDIRNITVEMTVVDGVIRYNQFGKYHAAVHDTGTFQIGIDDRGYWGAYRSLVGLRYQEWGHLAQGSLLISYNDNTVATALKPQFNYILNENGGMQFWEPGYFGDEESKAVFEDGAVDHPDRIQVTQQTYMWGGDGCLLVKYLFKNTGINPLSDLFFGQYMDFDVSGWANQGGWEPNNGLGFAYLTNPDVEASPYIGMALFNMEGQHANTGLAFTGGVRLFRTQEEPYYSNLMRNGIIETEANEIKDYTMVPSAGPFTIEPNQSVSPFFFSLAVGDNLEDLRTSINQSFERSKDLSLFTVNHDIQYNQIPGIDPKRLSFDLYIPNIESNELRPVLIFVHGGGWQRGDKRIIYRKDNYFTRQGYILASINYRFSPLGPPWDYEPNRIMHPSHVEDVGTAIAYIYKNIATFGGDSSRIALMGFSSGSHLTGLVSTDEQYLNRHDVPLSAIKATVGLDGGAYDIVLKMSQISDNLYGTYVNAFGTDSTVWKDASPSYHVDAGKGIPPFLLVYRDAQNRLENNIRFADSLTVHDIRSDLYQVSGLNHLQLDYTVGDKTHPMTETVSNFLAEFLGNPLDIKTTPLIDVNKIHLYQNFPNPFNPETSIEYTLTKPEHVRLIIFDLLGRHIKTLVNVHQHTGHYNVCWAGKDDHNQSVPAGIYFCRIKAGDFIKIIKLALVK